MDSPTRSVELSDQEEKKEEHLGPRVGNQIPELNKPESVAITMSTNSENVKKIKGSFRKEDISVYARAINKLLENRQEVGEMIPINPDGDEFFYKMSDGMIGIMLLNMIEEDRIDVRTVNSAKLKRS